MPGSTLPPSQTEGLNGPTGLFARVERIERRTSRPAARDSFEMTFSYPGDLVADVESPPWYPPRGDTLRMVRVSLLTAATADHVIEIGVDGVAIQQFTLATGLLTTTEAAAIVVHASSYVTVKTITVSDSNLSVQVAG